MASYISRLAGEAIPPLVADKLQPRMRGLTGAIIRGYLPQVWWFSTETGHATVIVDKQALCQVFDGQQGQPDVTMTWTDQAFYIALSTQDRSQLPPGTPEPQVQTLTGKGRTAFGQLRSYLGL
jgi:hypothetical protein